ncbi:MAG: redoxin domain-containing protein [Zoogloeaceae bacterium]|jgi:peroxiredoxin|nr:redoxin domain-containing protein [Zoogloeaceae bacterium]
MLFLKTIRKLAPGLCLSMLVATSAVAAPNPGESAPAFTGTGADGKPVNLEAFRGKTVILEWTNHECPFVRKHYESGNIPTLQKEATGKGIVWLQVISSAPGKEGYVDGKTAQQLNQSRKAQPSAVVLDPEGKIGKLYGAVTTPHLYIINAQGTLVYKGGIDSIQSSNPADIAKAENYVKLALADLSAGRPIAQNNTRPYGCTVKYAN